jgi:hypothetical protein
MSASGIGREGADFDPLLTLINSKTGLPYGLPGTYIVNLYRQGAVTPWVSGTLANAKLASVTNNPSTIKLNFLASDITLVGGTYITVEILRTDAGTDFIASFLVRMLSVGEALGNVGDGNVVINIGDLSLSISQPDAAFYQLGIGTVTTLAPGASATASIDGTGRVKTLNLGIPAGVTGGLQAANNLSDVTSVATARANLGLDPTVTKAADSNIYLRGEKIASSIVEKPGETLNTRLLRYWLPAAGLSAEFIVYAKAGSRRFLRMLSNSGFIFDTTINLKTGVCSDNSTLIEYQGGGWYKITISGITVNSGTYLQIIMLDDTLTWPGRAGDGVSKIAVRSAELRANNAVVWQSTSFNDVNWTLDGVTATDNNETWLKATDDIQADEGYKGNGSYALTSIPNQGEGLHGPGRIALNGRPYFIPRSRGKPDLAHAFRAAFAYEIANNIPVVVFGDSITWLSWAVSWKSTWLSLLASYVNQGSPSDEAMLCAVADYLLPQHGITVTGSTSVGTTGPLGESLVMQPGAALNFAGAYEQIDVFYNKASSAGSLVFAFNGTGFKTVNCSGAAELDKYSGPSLTGQIASGTYTITCTGAPVEITGIDRLGVKVAGSLPRARFIRNAHGSYNFGHFVGAKITSMVKQAAAYSAKKPTVILALGINERNTVGPTGYTALLVRVQQTLTDLNAAGVTRIFAMMPLRTSGPAETTAFITGLSYDNLIGGLQEVYRSNNIPMINLSALDLGASGDLYSDGIHPLDSGHYRMTQELLEWVERAAR